MTFASDNRRVLLEQILAAAPIIPVITIERAEDGVPLARALAAGGLPALEITLRTPAAPAAAAAIAAQVPEAFRFSFKAPQRITHRQRLREVDDDVARLIDALSTLGPRLGAILFQLPPRMPLNIEALHDLVTCFPPGLRAAFEFRDLRWHCAEVYTLLRNHGCPLCHNDDLNTELVPTTDWGYVRLRREHYTDAELLHAMNNIAAQPWLEAFVYVKHEAPDSPLLARRLRALATAGPTA